MKLWLKKVSVVLITFMTFGMLIPPTYLDAEATDNEDPSISSEQEFSSHSSFEINEPSFSDTSYSYDSKQLFLNHASIKAKEQAMVKFGEKIGNRVENEFEEVILPRIEEALEFLALESDNEDLIHFSITEKPSNGYGEKIFHIYDTRTNEDVMRFHVGRVKLPKRGYWFNFHYHLHTDNFEQHYQLGDIYWDKNTPPKWMS